MVQFAFLIVFKVTFIEYYFDDLSWDTIKSEATFKDLHYKVKLTSEILVIKI